MKDAPMTNPLMCVYGGCCQPCANYQLRMKVLENDITKYKCCQGYFATPCCNAAEMGEGSQGHMLVEMCCCTSCALSATRLYLQDGRNIVSDPCDNRIIRFNNCLQCFSCVLNVVAIFIEELRDAADCIDVLASMVYCATSGCMVAQMDYEMTHVNNEPIQGGSPEVLTMTRD